MPFCGALTTALNHYSKVKHVTEVEICSSIAVLITVLVHCSFLDHLFAYFCLWYIVYCAYIADGTVPRCPLPRRKIVLLRRRLAFSGPRSAQLIVKTTSTIFYEALEKVAINLLSKQLCKTGLLISYKDAEYFFMIQIFCSLKGFFSPFKVLYEVLHRGKERWTCPLLFFCQHA